jgi:hypothetical protein
MGQSKVNSGFCRVTRKASAAKTSGKGVSIMRHVMACALLFAAAPALAQSPEALAKAMIDCAVIPRDADRLACYDTAVAATSAEARAIATARAEASAKIAAEEAAIAAAAAKAKAEADALAAAEASKEAFGNESIKSRGKERFAPPPGELQEIETVITETFTNREGFSVFLLENGQLWREVDIATKINTRVGDKVRIERAALGGYKLNFLRQKRVILVKRMK